MRVLSAAPRASVLQGAESSHEGRLYLNDRVGKGDCVIARAHESERLVWLRCRRHHGRGLDLRLVQGSPQWLEVGRHQGSETPAGALCVSGKRRPVEEAEQLQLAVERQIDQRGQGLQPRVALSRAHPPTGFSTSGVDCAAGLWLDGRPTQASSQLARARFGNGQETKVGCGSSQGGDCTTSDVAFCGLWISGIHCNPSQVPRLPWTATYVCCSAVCAPPLGLAVSRSRGGQRVSRGAGGVASRPLPPVSSLVSACR